VDTRIPKVTQLGYGYYIWKYIETKNLCV